MVEVDQGQHGEPHRVEPQIPREREALRVVMVNRNQNTNEVIHRVRQDGVVGENNLAAMVERIMARNGGEYKPSQAKSYVPSI